MKLPLKWLKEYVDFNVSIDEFIERMMWRGFEIAGAEPELPGVSGIYAGIIQRIEKHPNADKLQICVLDVGQDTPVTIVTGAKNVFEGACVPAALDGALLANGVKIKPVEMRGVMSCGMLCSGAEIGITDEDYPGAQADGILILKGEIKPGAPIDQALGLDDVIFDIELTPNRPDCQSIIGICREAAAALGQKFKEPVIKKIYGQGNASAYASVTVENTQLCPRYTGRVVVNLKIEPSPGWMQKKLKSAGMRPINNIVDITNLVMLEYGHPMHAFDLSCVSGGHIVVRNAREGEKVTTLDGKERVVTPDMLLIADEEKGVGIAGVMGGENSEITKNTRATLFESAVFKSASIRSTARKLRHTTDAAARFIKGVEPVTAMKALERAVELVEELGAGVVVGDALDVCAADIREREVDIDWRHVNRILGQEHSPEAMAQLLESINIPSSVMGDALRITIPHYRVDIEDGLEADWDIAEEIGRLYGYYHIKPTMMRGDTFRGGLTGEFRLDDAVKDQMAAEGAYEIYNYNFMSPHELNALLLPEEDEKRRAVRILNPFGEDQSLMRTTLIGGMLRTLALNANRKTGHHRYFEVGNAHFDNNNVLPEERRLLGAAYYGAEESFFTLKGSVEALLESLGICGCEFVNGGGAYLHPGQKALIVCGTDVIGEMGAAHPKVLKAFGLPSNAYLAEISMAMLMKHRRKGTVYRPIPKHPLVQRDIAVVVDEQVKSADILRVINTAQDGVMLENAELFDVYRGQGIPEGEKSMAYSFTLRAREDKTLTDEEIQQAMNAVIHALSDRLNARLRV